MNFRDIRSKYLVGILVTFIVVVSFAIPQATVKNDAEWSNNSTLIVEIGVGVIITLVVLMIAKINEQKIDEKIGNIQSNVKVLFQNEHVKKMQVYLGIFETLNKLEVMLSEILKMVDDANTKSLSERELYKDKFLTDIQVAESIAKEHLKKDFLNVDYFLLTEIEELDNLFFYLRLPEFKNEKWDSENIHLAIEKTLNCKDWLVEKITKTDDGFYTYSMD